MLPPVIAGAFARLRAAAVARLHPDWRQLVRRAWSIRLMAIAAAFSFGEVVCTALLQTPPIAPVWWAMITGFFTAGGLVARLVAQKNLGASE